LATIGHENLNFGGFPPTRIDDLVWGLGTNFTPSPDLSLVLSYGHRNGVTAPSASLIYHVTGRTIVSATYSEALSTVSQDIANNLAISDLDPRGQLIDQRTGIPLLILNPVLGLQTGLFRTKQATANVTTAWERDQVFLFIYRYDTALVAQST